MNHRVKKRKREVIEKTSNQYHQEMSPTEIKNLFGKRTIDTNTQIFEFGVPINTIRSKGKKPNTMSIKLSFDGRSPNPQKITASLYTTITRNGEIVYIRTAEKDWDATRDNSVSFGIVYGPKMVAKIQADDVITETFIFTLIETFVSEESICIVCFDRERQMTIQTCGHFALCTPCASSMTSCPVCRMDYNPDDNLLLTFSP